MPPLARGYTGKHGFAQKTGNTLFPDKKQSIRKGIQRFSTDLPDQGGDNCLFIPRDTLRRASHKRRQPALATTALLREAKIVPIAAHKALLHKF